MKALRRACLFRCRVERREDGLVLSVNDAAASGIWINGGFFMFRQEILTNSKKAMV
jgi:hypothetical protein